MDTDQKTPPEGDDIFPELRGVPNDTLPVEDEGQGDVNPEGPEDAS